MDITSIKQAQQRIKGYVKRTTLEHSETLSKYLGTNVFVKYELFQKTGSFKVRGAFNKLLSLSEEERKRGVVAISGGNHAQAVAYASNILDVDAVVLMPQTTPRNYLEATSNYGATVDLLPTIQDAFKKIKTEIEIIKDQKSFFWSGKYHLDMNTRDTLVTDLNVLALFDPEVPESYQDCTYLMLGNLMPSLQKKVIEQFRNRPKLIAMDTMNFWMDSAWDDLLDVLKLVDGAGSRSSRTTGRACGSLKGYPWGRYPGSRNSNTGKRS